MSTAPRRPAGADIEGLEESGVPVVALNQDASRYFDYHHTMDDTLDKVRPDELAQNVAAWASFIYLVADSDIDFRALSAAAPAAPAGQLILALSQREREGPIACDGRVRGSEPAGAPVGRSCKAGEGRNPHPPHDFGAGPALSLWERVFFARKLHPGSFASPHRPATAAVHDASPSPTATSPSCSADPPPSARSAWSPARSAPRLSSGWARGSAGSIPDPTSPRS